ncbi:acyl transferase/acyl hydrolase/lysophospholipase [Hypoxylon sp. FL1150]|nr:acyl transferase/acyl hydrolase/lysophospholipase [Hypoxylon sp. FL1150]
MSEYNRYEEELLLEDPYLPPAKAEVDEDSPLRYTIKCSTERVVKASDDKISTAVWFQTDPLDTVFIDRIKSIRLQTESHDQGFVGDSYAGNWTWFELSILANGSDGRHSDGLTLTWESHRNAMRSKNYGGILEGKFNDQHDLIKFLKAGDVVAVRLCARFPGWEIHAREGKLIFDLFKNRVPREAPHYETYVEGIKAMDDIFNEINEVTQPKEMQPYIPRFAATTFRADAFSTVDEPPLRILSLDGGGVRGLASLHLLDAVMEKAAPGKLPYEVFDMIAGTSTGGLIAIMLGRLKMSIKECIKKYETIIDKVFPNSIWKEGTEWLLKGQRYDATNLENIIKDLIREKLGDAEICLLDKDEKNPCKVFVTAVFEYAGNNRAPLILRSYDNPQQISELPRIKIWEAARATSAAPSYFEPISVDKYKKGEDGNLIKCCTYRLVDGGLLANNPIGWLWTEVLSVFGAMRTTDCFLSIGTGLDRNREVVQPGSGFIPIPGPKTAESFSNLATNTEVTHILFRGLVNAFAPHARTPKYWRLNVSEEIPEYDEEKGFWIWKRTVHHPDDYVGVVDMDDAAGAHNQLVQMTDKYLARDDVKALIDACAEALRQAHLDEFTKKH